MSADEKEKIEAVSVFRFVLAYLVAKLAALGGLMLYSFVTSREPPISSTPITIAALGVAMIWYVKAVNRPMTGSEIVRFSLGNTLVDIALSLAWSAWMIWQLGVEISWEGIASALGVSDPKDIQLAILVGLVVGSLQVFVLSAFFAWLMSKKLPNAKSTVEHQ